MSRGRLECPSPRGISRAIDAAIFSVSIWPLVNGVASSLIPQLMSYPTAAGMMAFFNPMTHPIGMPKPTCISAVANTFFAGAKDAASQSWRTASGSRVIACEAKMVASVTI